MSDAARLPIQPVRRPRLDELAPGTGVPLFDDAALEQFKERWSEIQTSFVDQPREAVEQANQLVAQVTDRLMSAFQESRNEIERQWAAGESVSTEELRQALQRYRSFFHRLLTI